MSSIYPRGGKLWCRVKDGERWRSESTPFRVGDEAKARRYASAAQRAIDERNAAPAQDLAVSVYADRWIEVRRKLDLDWANDAGRLKHHVLPTIGTLLLKNVRSAHIVQLFKQIRTTPRPGRSEVASPRLVHNIYSVVSAMFRDAKLEDLIEQTPCELDARQLGALVDSDPEWRDGSVFTRDEARILISDAKIPPDRHMVYGFGLLAGMRPGEAAALRWRHYDLEAKPLGRLTVAVAYNTRKHRAKSTKTDTTRYVPVHPTLAEMLDEWRRVGWPAMHGRSPGPDDLIVPLPPDAAASRRSRAGEPFRGHDYSGKRWREEDMPSLDWRYREPYATKATFITLALDDGADPHVIETRVTHSKKSRGAFGGYNRGKQWEVTCTEVAKLQLTRLVGGAEPLATVRATGSGSSSGGFVEAAGVEREFMDDSVRVDPTGTKDRSSDVDDSSSTRTRAVANLATALAEALVSGDEVGARRLTAEIRSLGRAGQERAVR